MKRLMLAITLVLIPLFAEAHPGRLNTEGCHKVTKRFVYESGKVVQPGDYHCHRKLGQGFSLDGREVLQDKEPAPTPKRGDRK